MNHKLTIVLLIFVVFLLNSCVNEEPRKEILPMAVTEADKDKVNHKEGQKLMETKCYICHNPNTASHDDILAPPLVAVKRRYSVSYTDRAAFVDAVVEWSTDPKEENALMRGAVNKFKVMPNLAYEAADMRKIAEYIYDNEIDQPTWFEAHFKEEHPNGMGTGKGMGRGMGDN